MAYYNTITWPFLLFWPFGLLAFFALIKVSNHNVYSCTVVSDFRDSETPRLRAQSVIYIQGDDGVTDVHTCSEDEYQYDNKNSEMASLNDWLGDNVEFFSISILLFFFTGIARGVPEYTEGGVLQRKATKS